MFIFLSGTLIALDFLYFYEQTYDKARNAVALALSPVVKGLVDPDGALRDIRNLDSVRGYVILLLFLVPFQIVFTDYLSLSFI